MRKVWALFVAILFVAAFGYTQTATADIHGKVLSDDGKPLPGVTVTLTGNKIGTRTAVTTEEGNFRFLKLPVGTYNLKFELEGFETVVKKGLVLHVGDDPEIKVTMKIAKLSEEIVVQAESTIINTRKATIGANITKDMIAELPTSRNPWTVMSLVPGMMIDREDVGGNESGQQSKYIGLGADSRDSTWNVDGANITDPSAIGAAPAYLNVNAYEEMQITLGANDITAQTGGVQLNFVTKRAGNNYSGDFHLYVEDEAWELKRDESTYPEYYKKRGFVDPGIYRLYQYGVNFGGPIVKDKLWWFGSWAVQDIHSRTIVGLEDATWLLSGYGKINFQFGNTYGDLDIHYDNKKKWGRTSLGPANQDPGTYWDQTGPGYVFKGDLQQVMGNLMVEVKAAFTDGGFQLMPRANEIENGFLTGPDWLFYYKPTRYYGGGFLYYGTNRNTLDTSVMANYFMEGVLGGDHEIKIGADLYTATTTSQTLFPNERALFIYDKNNPNLYKEIWWMENGIFDADFRRISAYVSDTFTAGKLTINIGLRYDKEQNHLNGVEAPGIFWNGQRIFEKWIPPLKTPEKDVPAKYEVISPRLSINYDITGDGKNIVKFSIARYGSQSGNDLAWKTWVGGGREIDVYWADDGDNIIEPGEWSEDPAWWTWWNINTVNPAALETQNTFDPNYNSPLLDELILSFQKAITNDFAVSLTGYYKKKHNLIRGIGKMDANGTLETKDNWYYAGDFTFTNGHTQPYYLRHEKPRYGTYYTNYDKAYNRYMALQIVMNKRLSHKWMANASFTYQDWKQFRFKEEAFDLTNFDYFNEGVVAPGSGGSGLRGIYVNARWLFKFMGLYQLPYNWSISAVFQAREGYVIPYHEYLYRSGIGWTSMYMYRDGVKFGDDRLPNFWILNLSLQKRFKVSDNVTATFHIDGYNITNNNTTLKVNDVLGTESTGQIQRVLNPTVFQFGIKVNF